MSQVFDNKTQDIYHLASPITIEVEETIVNLEDFFVDISVITDVSVSEGFHVDVSSDCNFATISVINPDFKQISFLIVTTNSGANSYHIPMLRSRKVHCKLTYNPMGAQCSTVQIGGSMNSWNPSQHYFQPKNDKWELDINLDPGIYQYQLIADGNWFCDPDNPEKVDNGYGSYNSVLEVRSPFESVEAVIFTEKAFDQSIVILSDKPVDDYVVLWQNTLIGKQNLASFDNKLMIDIPPEAKDVKRSFIRVWAYNMAGYTNDLLIPLEYGNVVVDASQLTRDDKESQIIYFLMVDRFFNGDPSNDNPIKEPDLHAKLNYHGGDIAGIGKKMHDGYFANLGVNTLWISPLVQNPNHSCSKHGVKSTGYHGYWPVSCTQIDTRFGTTKELNALVDTAHKNGVNIILDFVANHVHEDNPLYQENKSWATPLYLPDGSKNIGRWEDQRYTTWFDEFLPTLDYFNPDVVDTMTEFALYWASTFNLDGYRHDATKHIPEVFWRAFTKKLKKYVMHQAGKRIYQIGETFGGRELLKTYVNSGIHDGQFSFNLFYEYRSAFANPNYSFENVAIALDQDIKAFGGHNLMGNITGNHDMPRFISYAGEDLSFSQNAEHEGWVRHITVKNPIGYKRTQNLIAFVCTIPGIPVIYYGDEIGMPGGGDPDNRRPMKFYGLNENEQATLKIVSKIIHLRRSLLSLIYGEYKCLMVDKFTYIYQRNYFDEVTIILFNKRDSNSLVYVDLPSRHVSKIFYSNFEHEFIIDKSTLRVHLKPCSFEIISTKKV